MGPRHGTLSCPLVSSFFNRINVFGAEQERDRREGEGEGERERERKRKREGGGERERERGRENLFAASIAQAVANPIIAGPTRKHDCDDSVCRYYKDCHHTSLLLFLTGSSLTLNKEYHVVR